jgi:hypothetical protein
VQHCRFSDITTGNPHLGYTLLSSWGNSKPYGLFSVTSNIDGHWQRTPGVGPNKLYEVHGTLTRMQTVAHGSKIWPTPSADVHCLEAPAWDLVPGEEVEVVERVEVVSSDLRFERHDLGLSPLRGGEVWRKVCVGKAFVNATCCFACVLSITCCSLSSPLPQAVTVPVSMTLEVHAFQLAR